MHQMQCSNCGSYKISTPSSDHNSLMTFLLLAVWPIIILVGIFTSGSWIVVTLSVVIAVLILAVARSHKQYEETNHLCLTCGKRWQTP